MAAATSSLQAARATSAGPLSVQALPIPRSFICPITQEVMRDPVVTVDGQAYEREAIQEWFRRRHWTSPATGQQLPSLELTSDSPLRRAIEEYMQQRPEMERHAMDRSSLEMCTKLLETELVEKQVACQFQKMDHELLGILAAKLRDAVHFPEAALRKTASEVAERLISLHSTCRSEPGTGSHFAAEHVVSAEVTSHLSNSTDCSSAVHAQSSQLVAGEPPGERLALLPARVLITLQSNSVFALAVLGPELLASDSLDKTVKLWDTASGRCLATLQGHTEGVVALAVLGPERLASSSLDETVKLWEP